MYTTNKKIQNQLDKFLGIGKVKKQVKKLSSELESAKLKIKDLEEIIEVSEE